KIMSAPFPALQGRNMTARGEAPGDASPKIFQALKGRHNRRFCRAFCSAPGRGNYFNVKPGALPRAITSRPFRASGSEETRRLETLYERKLAALAALKKSLLHEAFTGKL